MNAVKDSVNFEKDMGLFVQEIESILAQRKEEEEAARVFDERTEFFHLKMNDLMKGLTSLRSLTVSEMKTLCYYIFHEERARKIFQGTMQGAPAVECIREKQVEIGEFKVVFYLTTEGRFVYFTISSLEKDTSIE